MQSLSLLSSKKFPYNIDSLAAKSLLNNVDPAFVSPTIPCIFVIIQHLYISGCTDRLQFIPHLRKGGAFSRKRWFPFKSQVLSKGLQTLGTCTLVHTKSID